MHKNSHSSNTFMKFAAHKSEFLTILLVGVSKHNVLHVERLNGNTGH